MRVRPCVGHDGPCWQHSGGELLTYRHSPCSGDSAPQVYMPLPPLCRLFKASFWQLMALAAVAANGGTWGDTAILVTNVGLAAAPILPLCYAPENKRRRTCAVPAPSAAGKHQPAPAPLMPLLASAGAELAQQPRLGGGDHESQHRAVRCVFAAAASPAAALLQACMRSCVCTGRRAGTGCFWPS